MERHGVSGVMVCKVPVKSSGGLMWDGLRWCCLVLSVCIILDVVDGMKVKTRCEDGFCGEEEE